VVAARALKLRTDVAQIEQYKTNVQDAMSWLEITESAVANVGDILQRARELAVQASSGTTTEEDTKKIKQEVEQLKNQLIKLRIPHMPEDTYFQDSKQIQGQNCCFPLGKSGHVFGGTSAGNQLN